MIPSSPHLLTGEESIEKNPNNKQALIISISNSLSPLIISYIHNHPLQNLTHCLFLTNDKHILLELKFMIYSFLWWAVGPEKSMLPLISKLCCAPNPLREKLPKCGFSLLPKKIGEESSQWMLTKRALEI